jgi:hypothetical protein
MIAFSIVAGVVRRIYLLANDRYGVVTRLMQRVCASDSECDFTFLPLPCITGQFSCGVERDLLATVTDPPEEEV